MRAAWRQALLSTCATIIAWPSFDQAEHEQQEHRQHKRGLDDGRALREPRRR